MPAPQSRDWSLGFCEGVFPCLLLERTLESFWYQPSLSPCSASRPLQWPGAHRLSKHSLLCCTALGLSSVFPGWSPALPSCDFTDWSPLSHLRRMALQVCELGGLSATPASFTSVTLPCFFVTAVYVFFPMGPAPQPVLPPSGGPPPTLAGIPCPKPSQ